MSSFISRKKKYKFAVKLTLEELSNVPYINGSLYAKVRQIDGGTFCQTSQRIEVNDHCVKWGDRFNMEVKMSANASNGILNSCLMRISVRKELHGGRTFQKLGFVDLDLADFAGAGLTCKRSLLEGYSNAQQRSDNSTLKIWIELTLLSGDPLFKTPTSGNSSFYTDLLTTSTTSSSSSSKTVNPSNMMIDAATATTAAATDLMMNQPLGQLVLPIQQQQLHQQDLMQTTTAVTPHQLGHQDHGSSNSSITTRINAEDVIQELIQDITDLSHVTEDENPDDVGLEIFVGKDGTATLGSRQHKNHHHNATSITSGNGHDRSVTTRVRKQKQSTKQNQNHTSKLITPDVLQQ